ncbi:MAG: hypothetical protein J0H06_11930 [Actinobacteria bacterium]|nr:hypothetical protein [Actinomycetota bacterium]OJU86089.1 MAG: hypothetical protein BGO11_04720 [Solirubrobacterales bacterium 70-9]
MNRLKLVLGLGGVIALLASVGVAMATTGATTGYPQPKVVVPSSVSSPFENRYVLTAVGSGAGIRSGEMKFEFEEGSSPQFLVGISQFYLYSPTGEIETALFTFYPFTELPGGKGLKAPVLKVGASASYGQVTPDGELRLENPVGDKVKGEIRINGDGPWPVEFRILGEDESTHGHPPVAKQIPEAEPTNPGWGAQTSEYVGEYELTNAAEDPTAKAGTLGAVIGVAEGLGVNGAVVSGGSMTVGGNPATAEVTVETGSQKRTFTLTDLAWQGDKRTAQVHEGGAEGPAIGRFEGTGGQGTVKGSMVAGHTLYKVEFQLK